MVSADGCRFPLRGRRVCYRGLHADRPPSLLGVLPEDCAVVLTPGDGWPLGTVYPSETAAKKLTADLNSRGVKHIAMAIGAVIRLTQNIQAATIDECAHQIN